MKSNYFPDLYIANMLVNDGTIIKEDKYVKMASFLVREVCAKDCTIIGYAEAITNEMIINRKKRKYALRHGYTDLDVDSKKQFKDNPGDILWRVSRIPACDVLTKDEIKEYLSTDPELMKYSIDFYRNNTSNFVKKGNARKLVIR
jgi:hypothetical protein